MSDQNDPIEGRKFKVVVVGDSGVGKSHLIAAFTKSKKGLDGVSANGSMSNLSQSAEAMNFSKQYVRKVKVVSAYKKQPQRHEQDIAPEQISDKADTSYLIQQEDEPPSTFQNLENAQTPAEQANEFAAMRGKSRKNFQQTTPNQSQNNQSSQQSFTGSSNDKSMTQLNVIGNESDTVLEDQGQQTQQRIPQNVAERDTIVDQDFKNVLKQQNQGPKRQDSETFNENFSSISEGSIASKSNLNAAIQHKSAIKKDQDLTTEKSPKQTEEDDFKQKQPDIQGFFDNWNGRVISETENNSQYMNNSFGVTLDTNRAIAQVQQRQTIAEMTEESDQKQATAKSVHQDPPEDVAEYDKEKNCVIKLNIFDTNGDQKYRTITGCQFRNAFGAIICFDIWDRKSFQNLEYWVSAVKEQVSDSCVVILVGCKSGLQSHEGEKISPLEIDDFIYQMNLTYFDESMYLEIENNSSVQQTIQNSGKSVSVQKKNQLVYFEDLVLEEIFETLAQEIYNKANINVMNLRAYFEQQQLNQGVSQNQNRAVQKSLNDLSRYSENEEQEELFQAFRGEKKKHSLNNSNNQYTALNPIHTNNFENNSLMGAYNYQGKQLSKMQRGCCGIGQPYEINDGKSQSERTVQTQAGCSIF